MAAARGAGRRASRKQEQGGARDERDVEAGDRERVVDARAAEVREQGGRELPALADQEPLEERARHGREVPGLMTAWIASRVRSHQGSGDGWQTFQIARGRAVAK